MEALYARHARGIDLFLAARPRSLRWRWRTEGGHADYVFSAMFKLVWSVADRLAALNIKRTDVLSLLGRALFFRFLRDRRVVQDNDARRIARKATNIHDCFINAENAASTSAWLDKTFNGDLLSLTDDSSRYFEEIGRRTGGRVFFHLSAIIRGEEPFGDENYQIPLGIPNFGRFDFAHIPVGLLSQVYERFAWKLEHQTAKETSVHYTPRNIAATLVDEAFANSQKPMKPASLTRPAALLCFCSRLPASLSGAMESDWPPPGYRGHPRNLGWATRWIDQRLRHQARRTQPLPDSHRT